MLSATAAFVVGLVALPVAEVQSAAGARLELQLGRARLLPDRPAEATAAAVFTPALGVTLAEPRFALTARYAPRIGFRVPNLLQLTRPLLLHQAAAGAFARPARRVRLQALFDASLGEVDYVASPLLLRTRNAGAINAPVLEFQTYNGELRSNYLLSLQSSLTTFVRGGYLAPYSTDGGVVGDAPVFPRQRYGALGAEYEFRLTPFDALRVPVEVRRDDFSQVALRGAEAPILATRSAFFGGPSFLSVRAELAWAQRRASASGSDVGAGLLFVQDLDGAYKDRTRALPLAHAELTQFLGYTRDTRWGVRARADLFGLLDPVRADYRPIGSVTAALDVQFVPRWFLGVQGSFATTLTNAPLVPRESESVISAALPVVYSASRNLSVEFGARLFARASHLRAERVAIQEQQLWVYTALSLAFGTGTRPPAWVLSNMSATSGTGTDPTERSRTLASNRVDSGALNPAAIERPAIAPPVPPREDRNRSRGRTRSSGLSPEPSSSSTEAGSGISPEPFTSSSTQNELTPLPPFKSETSKPSNEAPPSGALPAQTSVEPKAGSALNPNAAKAPPPVRDKADPVAPAVPPAPGQQTPGKNRRP